ncbi:hypothetical protein C357_16451 [Citreicella sp. 357]|nr:hypothetical protein C357_16451 [Citreicella sp. 357]
MAANGLMAETAPEDKNNWRGTSPPPGLFLWSGLVRGWCNSCPKSGCRAGA